MIAKPLLVPLTSSLYVPGKLADPENVLVDVGARYYVEKVCDTPLAKKWLLTGSLAVHKRRQDVLQYQNPRIAAEPRCTRADHRQEERKQTGGGRVPADEAVCKGEGAQTEYAGQGAVGQRRALSQRYPNRLPHPVQYLACVFVEEGGPQSCPAGKALSLSFSKTVSRRDLFSPECAPTSLERYRIGVKVLQK